MALSSGLFVALLPRELIVSSDITNDALVVPLCALALLWYLLAERSRSESHMHDRRLCLVGMGLTLGAAAITKFSSLPLAAVLILLSIAPSVFLPNWSLPSSTADPHKPVSLVKHNSARGFIDLRLLLDGLLPIGAFLAVSGWWFVRNKHLYGQYLASKKSEQYLSAHFLLHPLPWTTHLFLSTFPHALLITTWYAQPNLLLSVNVNIGLAVIGLGASLSEDGEWWRLEHETPCGCPDLPSLRFSVASWRGSLQPL